MPEDGRECQQHRLGATAAYLEIPYRRDERGYSFDRAFVKFLLGVRPRVSRLTLVGRVRPGRVVYAVPDDVGVHPLPDYQTLKHLGRFVAVLPRTLRAVDAAVAGSDHVVAIGPHPVSIPVVVSALLRRKDVALMVRQDFPRYIRHRLPGRRWLFAVVVAKALDGVFRLFALRVPTLAVGSELAHRYRRGAPVLDIAVSLVPESERGTHPGGPVHDPLRLLWIGRLDPEKTPHVALDAVEMLRSAERRVVVTMVGTGELEAQIRQRADAMGGIELAGYVPHGPRLFALLRASDLLVHTALTEGVPQVIVEALGVGLPVVATDVGGVRSAVAAGECAALVPPSDPAALAQAIGSLADDDSLRRRLAEKGSIRTADLTIERQVDAAVAFLQACWRPSEAGRRPPETLRQVRG